MLDQNCRCPFQQVAKGAGQLMGEFQFLLLQHGALPARARGFGRGANPDAINLAARLMQAAAAGQILASAPVRVATRDAFLWDPLPPLRVKGKRAPVRKRMPADHL